MAPRASVVEVETPTTFAEALGAQEELLRDGLPAAHVAVVRGTVLSVGVGVPETAPYLRRAGEQGVPTVRRSSGGTGILHLDGDLVWAIVLPRSDPRVGRDFVQGYGRFGAGLVQALAVHYVSAAWVPAPGLSTEYCPLSSRGHVLEVGGRVMGAAAQHLTGTALLHHGTLSVSTDRELVRRLFAFPDPSIAERLVGLAERGIDLPPKRLADAVARELADDLGFG